jgi:hypothetical protein
MSQRHLFVEAAIDNALDGMLAEAEPKDLAAMEPTSPEPDESRWHITIGPDGITSSFVKMEFISFENIGYYIGHTSALAQVDFS